VREQQQQQQQQQQQELRCGHLLLSSRSCGSLMLSMTPTFASCDDDAAAAPLAACERTSTSSDVEQCGIVIDSSTDFVCEPTTPDTTSTATASNNGCRSIAHFQGTLRHLNQPHISFCVVRNMWQHSAHDSTTRGTHDTSMSTSSQSMRCDDSMFAVHAETLAYSRSRFTGLGQFDIHHFEPSTSATWLLPFVTHIQALVPVVHFNLGYAIDIESTTNRSSAIDRLTVCVSLSLSL
jgi:hypothetical protein